MHRTESSRNSARGRYRAICSEIPNGQGESIQETKSSLQAAIELILEDRREDISRGLPADIIQEKAILA